MIKSATVSARIDENIKCEAEEILQQLGIPVSVVINTLYHQIIIQKGVPFSMTLTNLSMEPENISMDMLNTKLQHPAVHALNESLEPLDRFRMENRPEPVFQDTGGALRITLSGRRNRSIIILDFPA